MKSYKKWGLGVESTADESKFFSEGWVWQRTNFWEMTAVL